MSDSGSVRELLIVFATLVIFAGSAPAQPENPVYVDDSPRAWELF